METTLQDKDIYENNKDSEGGEYDRFLHHEGYIDDLNVQDQVVLDEEAYSNGEFYETGKPLAAPSSFWITSLKIITAILFAIAVIVGLAKGIGVFMGGNQLAGFLVFLAFSLSAFVIMAVVMVLLNLAQDVKEIRSIIGRVRRR